MSFVQKYRALTARVENAVKDALENETAEEVKDIMRDQADFQVYSYEASAMAMATRRVEDGGLGDKRNMISSVQPAGAGEYELTVENAAPFQFPAGGDAALSDVVGKGLKEYKQPYPRPFAAGTQEQAISSGRAYTALMRGLKRQGF